MFEDLELCSREAVFPIDDFDIKAGESYCSEQTYLPHFPSNLGRLCP